ncbi:conjugal transfer nickase/helicase domain-containing protein [Spirabiliibacterium falconis]|uniref:conjugal transfer nickase/helicase domain-containing protein n=1 Tax=Spirabiliibacterium falconis TaxID=572023 RepID=UPI001AACA767|nr:DNA-binding domain-containing protein [Spirabiliibacterium falconis]
MILGSTNFWTCVVSGPRRDSSLVGYLIEDKVKILGQKKVFNNLRLTIQRNQNL